MKRNSIKLLTAALLLAGAQQAFAEGTTAGTDIISTATVDYKISGVSQATLNPTYTPFEVDRRVNLTVTLDTLTKNVAPNAQDQVLEFTVTNGTNDVIDVGLGVLGVLNGSGDDFDPTGLAYYVESGAVAGFDPTDVSAAITYIDELGADLTKKVYVVGDIPAGLADALTGQVVLTATALEGGTGSTQGAALVADTDANDPAVVENVFGDAQGATDGATPDGKHSAAGTYTVDTTTINVSKTSTVITDPFNLTTNPKAIPGATIQFCILVDNTGATAATEVKVDDPIPTGTTYVAQSIKVGVECNTYDTTAVAEDDDTTDTAGEETDGTSGSWDGSTIHTQVTNLNGATKTATMFRVKINGTP